MYSVPFDVLNGLEDAAEDGDDSEEDGPISATFLASELVRLSGTRKSFITDYTFERVFHMSTLVFLQN